MDGPRTEFGHTGGHTRADANVLMTTTRGGRRFLISSSAARDSAPITIISNWSAIFAR
jgi:hypothetical protein